MKRILVFGMTENPGGVEKVILNYYEHIDREALQFDFLCNSHEKVAYEDELIAMGGRTFHITARSKDISTYRKELDDVFKNHSSEWSAIWVNVSSLANIDYLKMAKKYGISKRIIHSHNSQNMDSALRGVLHKINRMSISKWATDFWACSEDAAHWFYNAKVFPKSVLIHNAIDVDEMRFDENKRATIREEYGWTDKYVIGNVGRLHFQKNQSFMIDIFKEYHSANPDSVLVLVGQGEDESMLKNKVSEYSLDDSVHFVGIQKDIQGWLSSFDLFLFPSVFEGLSVAALEAQANAVPTLASKGVIPEEVRMNDSFIFFELDLGAKAWSKKIEEMKTLKREKYEVVKNNFVSKGFEISTEAKKLQDMII